MFVSWFMIHYSLLKGFCFHPHFYSLFIDHWSLISDHCYRFTVVTYTYTNGLEVLKL